MIHDEANKTCETKVDECSNINEAAKHSDQVPLWNNLTTVVGFFFAQIALILLITFWLFSLVTPTTNPYVDIIGYMVLPGLLIFGMIVMPLGILIKSWRLKRRDPTLHLTIRYPHVDLNDPAQRRVAKFIVVGTFILLPVVAVSGYHGYHYTDSSEFCSKACHAVMEPQATAFEFSPHARVTCAQCHIGSGASWFVKSKLSGTRQVLAMFRKTYSRPIPPAMQHLRPARDTCEQCHWPKKFFGAQLRELVHFSTDESNTRREIDMLLKIGGGDETAGRAEGIHWHMALASRVDYVAIDDTRQDIPWIKFVDRAGKETIYRSDGLATTAPAPEGVVRTFDCMDCHNRPAHKFRSPRNAVDLALQANAIDETLPFIKREALNVLAKPYDNVESAKSAIEQALSSFYKDNYLQIWQSRRATVSQAIEQTQAIYQRNFFPYMRVDWQTYPDNIGHMTSKGCFRCHDGKHVNGAGETISQACSTCHTFLSPYKNNGGVIRDGVFTHPYELEGIHTTLRCDQCHGKSIGAVPSCAGCHTKQSAFRAGTMPEFQRFAISADTMAEVVDCESCHDLTEPTTIEAIDVMCMECHDDEEFEGVLQTWATEAFQLLTKAKKQANKDQLAILEALRKAGPLHNIEATRTITQAIIANQKTVQPSKGG